VSKPDLVQMQLGTNDVWSNIAPATIVAALDVLVNQMRANNANVRILVAQITPMLVCHKLMSRKQCFLKDKIALVAMGRSANASFSRLVVQTALNV